ncbi:MAG TPA: ROK family protein [Dehalococcoidia bacterium]
MPHRFIAGVDLGGTNLRIVIANEDGEVEARRSAPLPAGAPADVLMRVSRTIDDLARGVWVGASAAAIGVAMPGLVDPERGTGASLANLPGWDDVDVASALRDGREAIVAVENDANAAAIGEGWLGAARGAKTFVFVAYGTGIGAGIVLDGKLHRGANGLAGEIGFLPVSRQHVREGDWHAGLEGLAGGGAIADRARRVFGEKAKVSELFDAADAGDPEATAWLRATEEWMAMGVASLIATLDPDMIVFGGGVALARGERLLCPLRELLHRRGPQRTKLVLSELGEDAQILGAVKLAIDKMRESA